MVASGAFTPRSISGLALWLDASDTTSTYTTDAGPVTAVSSPTEIAGCVGWWDASDASTLFAADTGSTLATTTVGRWANKGTLGSAADLLQATSASRPTTAASTRNGRNVLSFDGTDDFLQRSFTLSQPCTVLMAFACPSTPGSNLTLIDGAGAGNKLRVFTSGSNLAMYSGAQLTSNILPSSLPAWGVRSFVFNGASSAAISGGLVDTAGNTGTTAADGLTVAAWGAGGSQFFGVTVAEIVVFNSALSTADRARVEAYLAQRWGVSGVHAQATASSDPVGYWRDKSGNARHATQSTAANRPKANAAGLNSRRSIQFFGGNTELLSLGNLSAVFPAAGEVLVAYSPTNDTSYGLYETRANSSYFRNGNGLSYFGTFSTGRQAGISVSMPSSGNHVVSMRNDNSGNATQIVRLDGAQVFAGVNVGGYAGGDSHVLGNNNNSASDTGLTGYIGEVLAFPRILSTAERRRLEVYLANRWGITLAPQVSNADAQDWINRVYANGGSVSASTASAVNTLCDSLDAASLRDRFYRLNLFCGTGLNACLVPLYRGPSLGGTQYGNTTDTNVGPFVSGDYTETGAGGGLLGNGTSKYLNTGLTVSDIGTAASGHMSVYHGLSSGANVNRYYMGANDATTGNRFYFGTDSFSTASALGIYGGVQGASQSLAANGHGPAGHRILSRETDSLLTHYHNGSVVATNTTGIATAVSNAAFAVFAVNRNGTVDRWHNSWISAYSIGLGLNSTQASAYRSILQTFQTALGRNV
jgi:hypothetical protein